jgi:hypothetical protein
MNNVRVGTPEAYVHLRVFDGDKVISEGATGNDGKF